jgi:hypothetical protein
MAASEDLHPQVHQVQQREMPQLRLGPMTESKS